MSRQPRVDVANEIYHVINRANARQQIFKTHQDYRATLIALQETLKKIPIEIFSYILMPNHWHFSVRPIRNGDMGKFFGKFTQKATQRWHASHQTAGSGHLFQGRFKSFIVDKEQYFIQLMKYIEANALRSKLVKKAEDWPWGSLHIRKKYPALARKLLSKWPVDIPLSNYLDEINSPISENQLRVVRRCVKKGMPFGNSDWTSSIVKKYGLKYTVRSSGRAGCSKAK